MSHQDMILNGRRHDPALANSVSADRDPILPLIAEEARLRRRADHLWERVDRLRDALPDYAKEAARIFLHHVETTERVFAYTIEEIDSWAEHYGSAWAAAARTNLAEQQSAHIRAARETPGFISAWDEADAVEKRCDAVFERIVATRATTLAGVIAQIELLFIDPAAHVEIILGGLRDIQQRLERPPRKVESEVIGFGEVATAL